MENREITAEFVNTKHPQYSLNWLLMNIARLEYYDNCWMLYCPKCESVSEETYNEIEARGFGITWKTKKSAQYDGYYLITWGAN